MMASSFKERAAMGSLEIVISDQKEEEDTVYVAVGKDVRESLSAFKYTLQYSKMKKIKICILHVHEPPKFIPNGLGGKSLPNQVNESKVRAYYKEKRQEMEKALDDNYLKPCLLHGVKAGKVYIELGNIELGIVQLVSQHEIRKLIMGAAADKRYSDKMTDLKSTKAKYVRQEAPPFCQIQFVCRGNLIFTREMESSSTGSVNMKEADQSQSQRPSNVTSSHFWKSISARNITIPPLSPNGNVSLPKSQSVHVPVPGKSKLGWLNFGSSSSSSSSSSSRNPPVSNSHDPDDDQGHQTSTPRSSCSLDQPSYGSSPSSGYLNDRIDSFGASSSTRGSSLCHDDHDNHNRYCEKLSLDLDPIEDAKRNSFDVSLVRGRAEKDISDALSRARSAEEALTAEKQKLEFTKKHRDQLLDNLQDVQIQKSNLERKFEEYVQRVYELEMQRLSAIELLRKSEEERDEFKMQLHSSAIHVQELKTQIQNLEEFYRRPTSSSPFAISVPHDQHVFIPEYLFSEIVEATNNFDASRIIGRGGYGSIFRGTLRHTEVAIKKPVQNHQSSAQGLSEFDQEVKVLGSMRHPNILTLIGACPEELILIYEYLPNGSLEERLNCKDNTPPLPWETRIGIAIELCSVLIFLHSGRPYIIVHGDLKPANILLDAHNVCKLGDFGICRLIPHAGHVITTNSSDSSEQMTTAHMTMQAKGTFYYADPEYLATGELTTKSDVYSFGIILLRLLTGKQAKGIIEAVKNALDEGNFRMILDTSAGEWPYEQAEDLARLALRCCDTNRRSRPDLKSSFWRDFEIILTAIQLSQSDMHVGRHD